jgi:hypothetical protein
MKHAPCPVPGTYFSSGTLLLGAGVPRVWRLAIGSWRSAIAMASRSPQVGRSSRRRARTQAVGVGWSPALDPGSATGRTKRHSSVYKHWLRSRRLRVPGECWTLVAARGSWPSEQPDLEPSSMRSRSTRSRGTRGAQQAGQCRLRSHSPRSYARGYSRRIQFHGGQHAAGDWRALVWRHVSSSAGV